MDCDNRDDAAAEEGAWLDPNLTEPRLQDELNYHRRHDNHASAEARRHPNRRQQRPKAAYGSKQQAPEAEMTQIRYFKYIPYRGMSEPEKRRYLSLGPARLVSSRTAPAATANAHAFSANRRQQQQQQQQKQEKQQQKEATASFWPSASKAKSLKVYDYHLAELSLAYRSPPSLLAQPRRLSSPPLPPHRPGYRRQQQANVSPVRVRSIFYQLHSGKQVPASAPSATQQQLTRERNLEVAEKETQISRGNTPFVESALSDYPNEPLDVVTKSPSNRLLNVVSVDECHVQHRRRRRRLRRVRAESRVQGEETYDQGEKEEEEEEVDEEEEEEVEEWDWEAEDGEESLRARVGDRELQDETASSQQQHVASGVEAPTTEEAAPLPLVTAAPPAPSGPPPPASTRPTTERSGRKKRRTEKEMRQIAAAKFVRRNEILREKMSIYLDWKLDQERMGLIELRVGNPAARFERFTMDLVHQEHLVANQYREMSDDGATGGGGGVIGHEGESSANPSPRVMSDEERRRVAKAEGQPTPDPVERRQELSLTEMYEALNA